MIIPIRCFTCNKVLANKWRTYLKKVAELDSKTKKRPTHEFTIEDISISEDELTKKNMKKYFDETEYAKILDELNLKRMCCRCHMLTTIDLLPQI